MSRNTIGDRIRRLRREHNVSQTMLANALGFNSPATVSAWENGKGQLTSAMIVGLCAYFGVSADYLLMGRETAVPDNTNRVMLERITDIKVHETTEWKGLIPTMLVLVILAATVVVGFVGPIVHEWVKFGFTLAWLGVFLIFSVRQLVRPFRPEKVVYMTPGTLITYRAESSQDVLARRSGDMVAVAIAESILSVISLLTVLMTAPSVRPVIMADVLILAASLVLVLSWTHAARITRHPQRTMVMTAHDFHRFSGTDLEVVRMLLAGMLFVSMFVYGMLWLDSDPKLLHAKAVFALGATFGVAIAFYGLKRQTTSHYEVAIELEKSVT
jgi:transcriptional regulator with XRE-family HTH domain